MRKLSKKIRFTCELELLSGLRVGTSKDNVEIGGNDNPVIRRKDNNMPYIPGSSLKGKMRSLLEIVRGENPDGSARHEEGSIICKVFGCSEKKEKNVTLKEGMPSKLIFRDAYFTPETENFLRNNEFLDLPYTELKSENSINRITGKADNPRTMERIPAGAKFNMEVIINIFDNDDEKEIVQLLEEGLGLLEKDYLGGCGSRGYGWVRFNKKEFTEVYASNQKSTTGS